MTERGRRGGEEEGKRVRFAFVTDGGKVRESDAAGLLFCRLMGLSRAVEANPH